MLVVNESAKRSRYRHNGEGFKPCQEGIISVLASDFGERLKAAMDYARLDLLAVAEAAGRGINAISRWRSGEDRPSWRAVTLMCQRLGWPTEMFAEGQEGPARHFNRLVNAPRVPEPSAGAYRADLALAGRLEHIAGLLLVEAMKLKGEAGGAGPEGDAARAAVRGPTRKPDSPEAGQGAAS